MLRYAITDRRLLGSDEATRRNGLKALAARLAANGVDFLQLREKDLPPRDLALLAKELLAIFHDHPAGPATQAGETRRPVKLLVNGRADVALAAQADGVHLPSAPGELTPAMVRRVYANAAAPRPLVSLSCHTLAEVERAATTAIDDRPDLILFGPVFEKRLAEGALAGTGLELLRQACATAGTVPVLALGGVTEATFPECLAAGAVGIAGIRTFLPAR